jgi:hypothetical protein
MAASIPTREPTQFRAGDTVQWTQGNYTDYSAADGWILSYYIVGAGGTHTATATTDSVTGYAVTLTAAETALLGPGDYAIEGKVALSGEVFTVYSSRLTVLTNFTTAGIETETRSYWRRVRDALRNLLEATAPDPTQAYTIFGERAVTLMTIDERLKLLAVAESNVQAEESAVGGGNKNIYMRFRNPR